MSEFATGRRNVQLKLFPTFLNHRSIHYFAVIILFCALFTTTAFPTTKSAIPAHSRSAVWKVAVQPFSSSSVSLSSSSSSKESSIAIPSFIIPQPTKDDTIMERHFSSMGIKGIDNLNVGVRTTTEFSVGGRGLFYLGGGRLLKEQKQEQNNVDYNNDSQKRKRRSQVARGDILAFIPASNVFTEKNADLVYPSNVKEVMLSQFKKMNGKQKDKDEQTLAEPVMNLPWPAILTTYACQALLDNDNDDAGRPRWSHWIRLWGDIYGINPTTEENSSSSPSARPAESYTPEELNSLANLAKSTPEEVQRAIQARWETIQDHFNLFQQTIAGCSEETFHSSTLSSITKETWADLHALVTSRTANLGPIWGNKRGIIPLHDMANHRPDGEEANIELFTVGDVRQFVGDEGLFHLLKAAFYTSNENKYSSNDATTEKERETENIKEAFDWFQTINERDVLLVVRKQTIQQGEELWLDYKEGRTAWDDEQERVWLLLQYGFPLATPPP